MMLEIPLLENCKVLTMKLEVRYLFLTLSSGTNFFIYQLSEGLESRKILPFLGSKKIHKPWYTFCCISMDFHGVIRVQNPTCIPSVKFQQVLS